MTLDETIETGPGPHGEDHEALRIEAASRGVIVPVWTGDLTQHREIHEALAVDHNALGNTPALPTSNLTTGHNAHQSALNKAYNARTDEAVTVTVYPHLQNGIWPVDQSFAHFWTDGTNEANYTGFYQRWQDYNPKPVRLPQQNYPTAGMPRIGMVWNFTHLDYMVTRDRLASTAAPILNIGEIPDEFFPAQFDTQSWRDSVAAYLARLVRYYNTGTMTTETNAVPPSTVINNPNGVANKITYWELFNEPSNSSAQMACTAAQYAALFNTCAAAMKAVDPTIKVMGPVDADSGQFAGSSYIGDLMNIANLPDVITWHNYGGGNEDTDKEVLDTLAYNGHVTGGLAGGKQRALNKPIFITEHNSNYANPAVDAYGRPWGPHGQVWGAEYFRLAGEYDIELIHQWNIGQATPDEAQFGMLRMLTSGAASGTPERSYWRNLYLYRMFPRGSAWLHTVSSAPGEIEALAVKKTDGTISVLVINKKDNGAGVLGGAGVPRQVNVVMNSFTATAATRRMIDSTLARNSPTGPAEVSISASSPSASFPGYGVAMLSLTGTFSEPVQQFPKLENVGRQLLQSSANTAPIPAPPGVQTGDIIVVHLTTYLTTDAITPPAGFTQKVVVGTTAGGQYRTYVFWKRATGDGTDDDGDTYNFTWSTVAPRVGYAMRISAAAASGDPFDVVNAPAAASGSESTPPASLTTLGPARLLLHITGSWDQAGDWWPPFGFRRIMQMGNNAGSVGRIGPAGSTGPVFSTCPGAGTSNQKIGILLAVKPA